MQQSDLLLRFLTPGFFFFFFSNSRIRPLTCSDVYEFHLLRGLPGSLLPLGLYQITCFGTRPSSVLSTCSSQCCLFILILSLIENIPNCLLMSSFLISSSDVQPFTDLKNRISAACSIILPAVILPRPRPVSRSLPTLIVWLCPAWRRRGEE
jgi:hypothetical protein